MRVETGFLEGEAREIGEVREQKTQRLAKFAVFETSIGGVDVSTQEPTLPLDTKVTIISQGEAVRGRQFYPESEVLF